MRYGPKIFCCPMTLTTGLRLVSGSIFPTISVLRSVRQIFLARGEELEKKMKETIEEQGLGEKKFFGGDKQLWVQLFTGWKSLKKQ
ncbi:hypothetical protein SADUNF_Sadunf08G0144400 [Salix dunnii]|uniref:Uncharacterized protein n=1 Tax=Salix dunnii TaxID=1413687 RepID=A0A835JUP5_9ROSI|nr:hypothetical protein SADUNF_Sadunf08G0144400 [Salix dunnii]